MGMLSGALSCRPTAMLSLEWEFCLNASSVTQQKAQPDETWPRAFSAICAPAVQHYERQTFVAYLGVCGQGQRDIDHVAKVWLQILIGLSDPQINGAIRHIAHHLRIGYLQQIHV